MDRQIQSPLTRATLPHSEWWTLCGELCPREPAGCFRQPPEGALPVPEWTHVERMRIRASELGAQSRLVTQVGQAQPIFSTELNPEKLTTDPDDFLTVNTTWPAFAFRMSITEPLAFI